MSADGGHEHGGVHPDRLRAVAAHLLTGVTVITAASDRQTAGCTANAVTSLSLDPPMMLACLGHESATLATVREAGSFAINLLGGDEISHDLCRRFAVQGADRFEGVSHRPGTTGAPLLEDALGWFECNLHQSFECGDHTVCAGLVIDADAASDSRIPLGFFRGQLFGVEAPAAESSVTGGGA